MKTERSGVIPKEIRRCLKCDNEFLTAVRGCRSHLFCSVSCSISFRSKGKKPNNFGKPSKKQGKTFEELYGVKRAKEIREKMSEGMDKRDFSNIRNFTPWYVFNSKILGDIHLQGPAEVAYAMYLDSECSKLSYIPHPESIKYLGKDGVVHRYHPDFYVIDSSSQWGNFYVDTKGWYRDSDKEKIALVNLQQGRKETEEDDFNSPVLVKRYPDIGKEWIKAAYVAIKTGIIKRVKRHE